MIRKGLLLLFTLFALLAPATAEDAYLTTGDGQRARVVNTDTDFQLCIDRFSGGSGFSSATSTKNLAIVIYRYDRETSHEKAVLTRVEQIGGEQLDFHSGDLRLAEPGHYNLYLVEYSSKWADPPTNYLLKMTFEVKP